MKVIFMVVYFLFILSDLALGFLDAVHWCSNDAECVSFCKMDSSYCGQLVSFCRCGGQHIDTTTTTSTTTTTKPLVQLECSNQKISVIESIAENLHVEDDRAGLCPGTNKHQTSEALVINKCNATARSTWVPSPKSVKNPHCSSVLSAKYRSKCVALPQ